MMTAADRAALLAPVEAALTEALDTPEERAALDGTILGTLGHIEPRGDAWTPVAYPDGARKPRFLSNAATVRANHLMHPDYIPRRAL